ncbi:MAG: BglII/BstYI family type II restriction endonuclease [Sterolibacterium sp.]|nr:BglII/BstYI family type II restriction endonuclease [Sterolibacterium sp.]
MKISDVYSHFNGLEYLQVRRPELWKEVESIISKVVIEHCSDIHGTGARRETEKMPRMGGLEIRQQFCSLLIAQRWARLPARLRKQETFRTTRKCKRPRLADPVTCDDDILDAIQTDFVKDRVAIEVQFGKYAFVAYDLFVKHLAFYVRDQIDVGIEILPMKSLQSEMSSGPGYYEGELYNVIRNRRGVPAVPLVMVGIAP